MDLSDRAQEGIDNALADALADHFRNTTRKGRHKPLTTQEATPPPAGRAGDVVVCIDCEEEIDPRRLAVHPAAIRCIDCQEEFERSRRP